MVASSMTPPMGCLDRSYASAVRSADRCRTRDPLHSAADDDRRVSCDFAGRSSISLARVLYSPGSMGHLTNAPRIRMGLIAGALLAATGCATTEWPQTTQQPPMDAITATNIFLLPDQAVSLTLQGIAADRMHAAEITAAAVTAAPDQEAAIESAAVAAAPERAADIRQAVAIARAPRERGGSALS